STGHVARRDPERKIDMPFLMGTIPQVKRLADAFRSARRPVVYLAHRVKPDYSDAQWPYWRLGVRPGGAPRSLSRAPGGRRLSTSCNPGTASTWSSRKALAGLRTRRSTPSCAIWP